MSDESNVNESSRAALGLGYLIAFLSGSIAVGLALGAAWGFGLFAVLLFVSLLGESITTRKDKRAEP